MSLSRFTVGLEEKDSRNKLAGSVPDNLKKLKHLKKSRFA